MGAADPQEVRAGAANGKALVPPAACRDPALPPDHFQCPCLDVPQSWGNSLRDSSPDRPALTPPSSACPLNSPSMTPPPRAIPAFLPPFRWARPSVATTDRQMASAPIPLNVPPAWLAINAVAAAICLTWKTHQPQRTPRSPREIEPCRIAGKQTAFSILTEICPKSHSRWAL